MKRCVPFIVALAGLTAFAQDATLEYRVKAAYLFHFTKFVEWPAAALPENEALTLCVAAPNPFDGTLADIIEGERVAGRSLAARTVGDVNGCHVLFVPESVAAEPLLRGARTRPVLTVGESPDFLRQGGIINFVLEDGKVRFEINQDAATQADLRISSRLLRLARPERSTK